MRPLTGGIANTARIEVGKDLEQEHPASPERPFPPPTEPYSRSYHDPTEILIGDRSTHRGFDDNLTGERGLTRDRLRLLKVQGTGRTPTSSGTGRSNRSKPEGESVLLDRGG